MGVLTLGVHNAHLTETIPIHPFFFSLHLTAPVAIGRQVSTKPRETHHRSSIGTLQGGV